MDVLELHVLSFSIGANSNLLPFWVKGYFFMSLAPLTPPVSFKSNLFVSYREVGRLSAIWTKLFLLMSHETD